MVFFHSIVLGITYDL